MRFELCKICDEQTGKAGRCEDSNYCDECGSGPYCDECFDKHSPKDCEDERRNGKFW